MAFLDKEELKELLYLELALSQEIEQVIRRLKKAGHDLKGIGEALEKHPLLSPLAQPGDRADCKDNKVFFDLLMEYSGVYSFTIILSELANLKQQRDLLEDIQKRLYPVRNPGKT
ncbi:MAG TPA: hypothetical protein VMW83_14565 [Spirochaetia bacterium]|nr:hypothetical protein [Spirochaetia bacterium]